MSKCGPTTLKAETLKRPSRLPASWAGQRKLLDFDQLGFVNLLFPGLPSGSNFRHHEQPAVLCIMTITGRHTFIKGPFSWSSKTGFGDSCPFWHCSAQMEIVETSSSRKIPRTCGLPAVSELAVSNCRTEWWAVTGSNRRPSRCKRDALPTELTARSSATPGPSTGRPAGRIP